MTDEPGRNKVSGPDEEFSTSLTEGKFRIQQCNSCSAHCFPPRTLCPVCSSRDLEWRDASGIGWLHAFTIVRRSIEKGGDYNVVLVDLKEGPRMMSRVDGVALEDLKIGMALQAHVAQEADGDKVIFRPGESE